MLKFECDEWDFEKGTVFNHKQTKGKDANEFAQLQGVTRTVRVEGDIKGIQILIILDPRW